LGRFFTILRRRLLRLEEAETEELRATLPVADA
jgi:hypothetical protein